MGRTAASTAGLGAVERTVSTRAAVKGPGYATSTLVAATATCVIMDSSIPTAYQVASYLYTGNGKRV